MYLLGTLEHAVALKLQRDLARQVCERGGAALVLCEHPPLITVGRHGGPAQMRAGPEELAARGWSVRWVPRGGGAVLHLPGQLAIYPVLPLRRLGLDVGEYIGCLQGVLTRVLRDFAIEAKTRPGRPDLPDLYVSNRVIAALGIAVREGASSFGAVLNIDPDLTLFRFVQTGEPDDGPMTSLARERRGPLRPALVRQRLVEHFRDAFGFAEADVLFHAPGLPGHARIAP